MVAVSTKTLATLVALALVVSPLGLGPAAGELETIEPECYPADDGSGAYICEFPDACEEDLEETCDVPSSCELVDEHTVRCEPADEETTKVNVSEIETGDGEPTIDDLLQPPADGPEADELDRPMATCGLDNETAELVCEPSQECEESDAPEYCQPPDECESVADGVYRCTPGPGEALPEQAQANREEDRPREDPNRTEDGGDEGPDCQPATERGAVICQPPAECREDLGETAACTPPPECEDLGDGTFRCEIPDRLSDTEADPGAGDAEQDPFAEVDAEDRTEAQDEIAQGIREAADTFSAELDTLRADYEQRVDELRAEYQDSKDTLRADYQACREEIPSNASVEERNEALESCLQEAREGLASLRADMRERHDQVKQALRDRADTAREQACTEAENVALDAVADRGLFTANPADLVPDQALELCPAFADFDRGGEL